MIEKLVSIIIPTYNRADKLKRAVDSALAQDYSNFEVIVVDDNNPGTEGRLTTSVTMEEYIGNPKVQYIQHPCNKNGSAARNTGYRASKGEYLAFLDDDDEYLPNKIREQVNCLENRDSSWGACYCRYIRKTNSGKLVSRSNETKEGYVSFDELCRNFWHGGGTGPMIRRSVYEEVGGFDETFQRNQDYEFMLKITKRYKLAFVDAVCYIIYVHDHKNLKVTYDQILNNYLKTFEKEINALSDDKRREFDKIIDLQSFRYYLGIRNFNKLREIKSKGNITYRDITYYMFHLLYRRIFKISCGYHR